MRTLPHAALGIAMLGLTSTWAPATLAASTGRPAELVTTWNQLIFEIAEAEDRFLTLKGLRTATMAHLAIHDAVNAVDPRFATYLEVAAAPDADPAAAATEAAYAVAVSQYPDQAKRLQAMRDRWLAQVTDQKARLAGVELGRRTARAILSARGDDGWDTEADYQWHPMAPGVYAEFNEHSGTPEGFVFGAGWAEAIPFALDSPSHFRAPPPPEVTSDDYTLAFAEVKEVGAAESATRTADQTHLAMWWKEFVESSHNRLTRELAVADALDLWTTARVFALLNISIYDAYVNVFENKFRFNHWRPYTAIRWASNDGNPATMEDPDWDNLHHHTYAFPSYPSAHGTACAAAMTVLADTFGDARPVTMTISHVDRAGPLSDKVAMDPPTRSFTSFAEAAEECSLSRVYLGIHFRYDSVEGTRLGRKIGAFVVDSFLRPLSDNGRSATAPAAP